MSSVDLLIVAAVVLAAVTGIRAGFVATLYGLITWLVAIPVALVFQGPLGALLARSGLEAPLARTLGFVAVLLLIEIFFAVLGAGVINPMVKDLHAHRILAGRDEDLFLQPSLVERFRTRFTAGGGGDRERYGEEGQGQNGPRE